QGDLMLLSPQHVGFGNPSRHMSGNIAHLSDFKDFDGGYVCLVAKATSEESMLWHRRLGHVNFKNINKLVKENLVRDLPLKRFENDQTCVACLKGKCYPTLFNPLHNYVLYQDARK
ncbi:ribonuclease H-like domain-containing protein, partial [Tanacetum coccineum]